MTSHSVLDQPSGSPSTFAFNGSVARNFKLRVPLPFTAIWYYPGVGNVLPTKCALYDNTGTLVPGTLKTSPVWSSPTATGWVKTVYDGSVIIPADLEYQANCYVNSATASFGAANPEKITGPVYHSLSYFDNSVAGGSGDISYVTGINTNDFLVDVGVDTPATLSVSDNFNRADGGLGSNWVASPDTAADQTTLIITSNAVTGQGAVNAYSWWGANAAPDDQYAEVAVTTLPTAGAWAGPTVRGNADGSSHYVLIAWDNGGNPTLELFKRIGGNYTALGSVPWPSATAGDVIRLEAFGKNLTGYHNGTPIIIASDTDLTWGMPGLATFRGTEVLDNWAAGNVVTFPDVQLTSTVGHVKTYSVETPLNRFNNAGVPTGPQDMRVLTPTTPNPVYAHAFLWLLPVEPGQGTSFGDPIAHIQSLGYQDTYNLTCIQPGFPINPWYANNDSDPGTQQETYLLELVNWAKANLVTTGREVHYLIGFSKSGIGSQRMFFRNQGIFTAVASWDFPGDETYTEFGIDSAQVYGSQANFDNNYAPSSGNLTTWKAEGDTGSKNRIWISGYVSFDTETTDYDAKLTTASILHTFVRSAGSVHNWVSSPDWMAAGITFVAAVGPPPTGGLLMSGIV